MFVSASVKAQTLEQGKPFCIMRNTKVLNQFLKNCLRQTQNDVDAAYWLGQTLIIPDDKTAKDIADAKALYQKTLMANSSSALLMAGMGHIELLEEKPQDARNHFETAISLSQSKIAPVLNAVGFTNVNAKNGDAAYAVDKLKLATSIKKMTTRMFGLI
jgi:hypothetical protein